MNSKDIFEFSSDYTTSINSIILELVQHISSSLNIPHHMMGTCIKTSIVNQNTYFLNPVISAISTSLALLLKSIASGIPTLLLRSCS